MFFLKGSLFCQPFYEVLKDCLNINVNAEMRIRLVNTKLVKPRLKKRRMFFQINFKPISNPDKQQNALVFRIPLSPRERDTQLRAPALSKVGEGLHVPETLLINEGVLALSNHSVEHIIRAIRYAKLSPAIKYTGSCKSSCSKDFTLWVGSSIGDINKASEYPWNNR